MAINKVSLEDKDIKIILLQFSFSNKSIVPLGVRWTAKETSEERAKRTQRAIKGICVISPTEKVFVDIFEEIENMGFVMINAFYKPRIDPKDEDDTYQMVRFTFATNSPQAFSENFKKIQESAREELRRLCNESLWRVRAYLNPFFSMNKIIEGKKALSINMEVRGPLFHKNGSKTGLVETQKLKVEDGVLHLTK